MGKIGRNSICNPGKPRVVLFDAEGAGRIRPDPIQFLHTALGIQETLLKNNWLSPKFHFTGGETQALRA